MPFIFFITLMVHRRLTKERDHGNLLNWSLLLKKGTFKGLFEKTLLTENFGEDSRSPSARLLWRGLLKEKVFFNYICLQMNIYKHVIHIYIYIIYIYIYTIYISIICVYNILIPFVVCLNLPFTTSETKHDY